MWQSHFVILWGGPRSGAWSVADFWCTSSTISLTIFFTSAHLSTKCRACSRGFTWITTSGIKRIPTVSRHHSGTQSLIHFPEPSKWRQWRNELLPQRLFKHSFGLTPGSFTVEIIYFWVLCESFAWKTQPKSSHWRPNYCARPPFFTQTSFYVRQSSIFLSYIEGFFVIHWTLSVCCSLVKRLKVYL